MKNLTWIFITLLTLAFVSCESTDLDEGFDKGTVVFDLTGLNLEEDTELKSASNDKKVQIIVTIDDRAYNISEGEAISLPAGNYAISKFEIIVNDVHKYMLESNVKFEVIAYEIVIVQIPIFHVDGANN